MDNIMISNSEKYNEIEKKIVLGGIKKLQVIVDFDNTLTYAHRKDGKKIPSLISILRDGDYISKDYAKKAHELYDKYHPLEKDLSISEENKKEAMKNWWTEHFDLLIKSGLKKSHLEAIVDSGIIKLRESVSEMINYLHEKNIPLVILSSSGVGDALKIFLEKQNLLYDNVYLITNFYNWDEKGNAVSVKEPIIHGKNKDETSIRELPKIYNKLKNRKNVLLLGDNKGDLEMSKGFEYENILKIGFLNENVKERLNEYKDNFDVVITNDSNAKFVYDLLKKVS